MPPQTRAAARRVVAPTPLDALPLPLVLRIFALLPADARLLAAAVCRCWRSMLAEPALWTRLDLSKASGVANPRSNALLSAAAARAGGQLQVLRMCRWDDTMHQDLLAVLAANAATMRELALCTDDADTPPDAETVAALLLAAPGLRLLETGVFCEGAVVLPMLRREPPFGPLRLKRVDLQSATAFSWLGAVADGLAAHTSLEVIKLHDNWPQARVESDALVGALLSLPLLRSLFLVHPPASVLARLLSCPTLGVLLVSGWGMPLLDSPASTALLCDALRANMQLETLKLTYVDLWRDMDAAAALLATLQAHPSLQHLGLAIKHVPEHAEHAAAAAGAALGALIAHSPALEALDISYCRLSDAVLGLIFDALPHARHLQKLDCTYNGMSHAFVRERLLPAVRACAPLRSLQVDGYLEAAADDALLLLQQRR